MTIRRPFAPVAAILFVVLSLALTLGGPEVARAQIQGGAGNTYTNCLNLAQQDPESALKMAEEWVSLGGGNPARHCAAIALLGLLRYEEAAIRLQTLVDLLTDAPVDRRAAAREQAAQAWLLAGQTDRAESNLTAALALRPGNVELLISRAIARASAADYWNAIDDLNAALATEPERLDALVLRATAYRYLESLDLARQDAERAVALDPMDPDARLERSLILWRLGEQESAIDDWRRILDIAPDSGAAMVARENMKRLSAPAAE